MKKVMLRNGVSVPAIGQGTWHIDDDPRMHDQEVEARGFRRYRAYR